MKFLNIDKRLIWLAFGLVFAVPVLFPVRLTRLEVSDSVTGFYNAVTAVPAGGTIIVSMDFEPSFNTELRPMAEAVCAQAFARGLKVIGLSLVDTAVGTAQQVIEQSARRYGKVYGRDYAYLGWQPNQNFVIQGITAGIPGVFPHDIYGNPLSRLEMFNNISTLNDIPLVVQVGAGFASMPPWLAYGTDKTGGKLVIACNGGAELTLRPYYASGQLAGLVPSVKGGAEYEQLLGYFGPATRALNAISVGQLFMVVLMLAANFLLWRSKGYPLPWRRGKPGV